MNRTTGLTAFIVDDNEAALTTLASDLRNQPEIERVLTFSSYSEALLPILELQPNVLFLDVEVPGRSGLDFLRAIKPRLNFTFNVVFYTAFSNYMLDAIRQSAFDFLLKPYKMSELRTIIDRLIDEENEPTIVRPIDLGEMPRKMAMQTINELLLITPEQILMFTYLSDIRSWQLTLTDRSTHVLKKGMTAEDLATLHPTIARISNTCLINLTYLAAVENTTQHCRLCPPFDNIDIVASRRYFVRLKERLDLL